MLLFYVFAGLLAAVLLFAWWRGGAPERAVATMFLAAWLATLALRLPFAQRYHTVAYHTMAVDALLLIGLLVVSRRANRAWPTVAASLQLLIVLAHVARAVNVHQFPRVYMIMTASWPILQLIVLSVGTALLWRRTATQGAEPSWRS